jgi:membrane-associated protease RseP (regulator of RpoE activity)
MSLSFSAQVRALRGVQCAHWIWAQVVAAKRLMRSRVAFRLRPAVAVLAVLGFACSAVYPEVQTPVRSVDKREVEPPPKDLLWIHFKGAVVPGQTRDGRKWGGDLAGHTPDPYAVLFLNGKMLLKTPAQSGTLAPTWPDGPAGNFRLRDGDRFRVELWDSNTLHDHPIGIKEIGALSEEMQATGEAEVECDTGARVRIAFEPAHGRVGLGFYYELRIGEVFVTRVYEQSPAGRAGVKPGDQILTLDGKPVAKLKTPEVRSILNTPHLDGLTMTVQHPHGQEVALTLKEGAIYPLFSEIGQLR